MQQTKAPNGTTPQNGAASTASDVAESKLPLFYTAPQRLNGVPNVFASPVGASGRIYIPGREGTTIVIRNSPTLEVLATNVLDDGFDASPALVDREIYLRGNKYLYCIAAQ